MEHGLVLWVHDLLEYVQSNWNLIASELLRWNHALTYNLITWTAKQDSNFLTLRKKLLKVS
jgi:hypothetical protein